MYRICLAGIMALFIIAGCEANEPAELSFSKEDNSQQPTDEGSEIVLDGIRLEPEDQSAQVEDFFEFKNELLQNLDSRNIDYLKERFHDQGNYSFGGITKEQLFTDWNESYWLKLKETIELGGVFVNEEKTLFIAPYIFQRFPKEFDPFLYEVALLEDVNVYSRADVNSEVIARLDYHIVKVLEISEGWKMVELPSGDQGYAASGELRSPVDYRIFFAKENGKWVITTYIAGD